MEEYNKIRFIRWQGITMTQMGQVINTLFLASGTIVGFSIAHLLNVVSRDQGFFRIKIGSEILSLCVALLLLTSIVRLYDFRCTSHKIRSGNSSSESATLGKITWALLYISIITFLFGSILTVIGFYQFLE